VNVVSPSRQEIIVKWGKGLLVIGLVPNTLGHGAHSTGGITLSIVRRIQIWVSVSLNKTTDLCIGCPSSRMSGGETRFLARYSPLLSHSSPPPELT
jgi:hypothetical protein